MRLEDIKPGWEFAYQTGSVSSTGKFIGFRGKGLFIGEICPGRPRVWPSRYIIAARQPRTLFNWFPRWEVVE